jgi:hypothetical protein
MRRRTFLHTRIFTEVLVWFPTGVLSYADTSVRQHVCTSMHQYICMSVHQRSGVSVRPCGPAVSNVCFRPCPFICLVASSFLSAKEYTNPPVCIVSPLRGSIWLRSGSLWRCSAPSRCVFTPYLCPPSGRAMLPMRTPPPVSSLFWAAGRYRATDTCGFGYRQVYPQSVADGFLLATANSKVSFELLKGFPVTPGNDLAPCGGGLPLRSREACFLPAVCVPEAALVP